MRREKIIKLWDNYIKGLFADPLLPGEIPFIFESPHCATCAHWQLFGEDEMEVMSEDMYDLYYDKICKGIKGEIDKINYDSDGSADCYQDYRFFGFCKRYPPSPNDDDQFTVKPRPLLLPGPRFIFEYKYPITDQEEWCGEWKRGEWYWCKKEFIAKMSGEEELSEKWEVFFRE